LLRLRERVAVTASAAIATAQPLTHHSGFSYVQQAVRRNDVRGVCAVFVCRFRGVGLRLLGLLQLSAQLYVRQ